MHAVSVFRQEQTDLAYRVYMTDSARLRGEGKYISKRWHDMVRPGKREDADAEEIIADIASRAGLEVVRHELAGPGCEDHVR